MPILLTDEEIGEIIGSCKEWFEIPDKVAKAQLKKVIKSIEEMANNDLVLSEILQALKKEADG